MLCLIPRIPALGAFTLWVHDLVIRRAAAGGGSGVGAVVGGFEFFAGLRFVYDRVGRGEAGADVGAEKADDAARNGGRAEEDEAAQDHLPAAPDRYAAGEHGESDEGYC